MTTVAWRRRLGRRAARHGVALAARSGPGRMSPGIMPTVLTGSAMVGMLLSGLLVWAGSEAAFSATAQNPASSFTAGTVSLSDDDSTSVMFNVTGIQPGDSGSKCITVTYTGNVTANVRLYATLTGTLGSYLNVTVAQGTGGSFASCTSFSSETSTSGTLAAFAAARTNFATGFGSWTPTGAGQTRTYQISWSVAADNAAANKTAGLALTWEAQG